MKEVNEQPFINVAVIENVIEAQLIDSILTEQSIPHRIRSYHDTAYNGLFQFQLGWGEVYAPQTYKQEILDIMSDIRSQHQNINR